MEMNSLLLELINLSSREKEGEIHSCRKCWDDNDGGANYNVLLFQIFSSDSTSPSSLSLTPLLCLVTFNNVLQVVNNCE